MKIAVAGKVMMPRIVATRRRSDHRRMPWAHHVCAGYRRPEIPRLSKLLLLLALIGAGQAQATMSVSDFTRHARYSEAVLSPDGAYLAVNVVRPDSRDLAVIRVDDMSLAFSISAGQYEHVYDLNWASDTRLVVSLGLSGKTHAQPIPTGEIMSIERDGADGRYLFGMRGTRSDTDNNPDRTRRFRSASQVSPMQGDPEHALIQSFSIMDRPERRQALAERLELKSGRSHWATRSPITGTVEFLADGTGEIRYVQGESDQPGRVHALVRDPATDEWSEIPTTDPLAEFVPLHIADDNRTGYLKVREGSDRYCLHRHDLVSGKRSRMACHPTSDLSDILTSPSTGHVIGAVFDAGPPIVTWVNPSDPDSRVLRGIAAQFQGNAIHLTSRSRDGRRFVVRVDSDINPGRFYLFDRDSATLRYLLARRPWIDSAQMPTRQSISWRNGDTMIHGYLTVPQGAQSEPAPLVVMPHGGPFDVRDTWAWHAESALLASRGYLVLQPQYRGSGGFGRTYRNEGRHAIGSTMTGDIAAGITALIQDQRVDPNRIAMVGESFGATLSVMMAAQYPDSVAAIVGIAGGYDLVLQRRELVAADDRVSLRFFDAFTGSDKTLLKAHSPIQHVESIRAPALLFHGKHDRTIRVGQARRLVSAWPADDKPNLTVFDDEGHSIFAPRNRAAMWTQILDFLDEHIGNS